LLLFASDQHIIFETFGFCCSFIRSANEIANYSTRDTLRSVQYMFCQTGCAFKMREIDNPPHAASLMESMRSIGYSLETALADLIDNSISAKARQINIEFRPFSEPYIAIMDDGLGMTEKELHAAMRHGSRNPLEDRRDSDLGRYGLGLKTSSLSQCRRMTVVSLKDKDLSACCWDLDVVVERQSWVMLSLDEEDIDRIPHVELLRSQGTGTLVLWQKLDRLTAGESSTERAMGQQIDQARRHLALVFHRYIAGEQGLPGLGIAINQNPLEAIDPFLLEHRATQRIDEDRFIVEGKRVIVKPFILPHISKLTPEETERAGGSEGLRSQQGFYVYRNRRLIIWGTWFRLARKDELSKLARVRVDIPNSLDHLWTLDIKKSAAYPPEAVRINLRRTVERIREFSGRTIVFRGRAANTGMVTPGWSEVVDRNGVRFDINRNHPAIKTFESQLADENRATFDAVLRVLESSFPADALYARMASEMRSAFNGEDSMVQFEALARALIAGLDVASPIRSSLLRNLHLIEPFSEHPENAKKIAQELMENESADS
jgi:hypothetical protein